MKSFLEDFADNARRIPDEVVMVDREGVRETTYAEMYELIGRIAAKLRSFEYPAGTFITLQMDRCVEYIAAYYGIIMAGYAAVPTVPDYPKDRVEYIMKDSASPYKLTESFFSDIEDYKPAEYVALDPDSTVCMNYTSGSTGNPKGVFYNLRCVSEAIRRSSHIYDGLDEIINASSATFSFAALCNDCLAAMYAGGTVHILSDRIRRDVSLMQDYYEKYGIVCGNISPGMLRFFGHTSKLKRVFTTGERVVNIYSDEHDIYCVYGLTEAYTAVTSFLIDRKYENTPIGKPIGNVLVQILDEEGNEVPDGTEGEIFVTGYLSTGYYHMPEETARSFTHLEDGRVRFSTHDLGYKDENGNIIYVNRKDWMVKINGQRVEPYEIEAVASAVPGVKGCVVKDFQDASGRTYLCAYYVTESEDVTGKLLEQKVSEKLPPYMVPAHFIKLDAFPLTVSGKIDKKPLEPPKAAEFQQEYEAPLNADEENVCHAIEKVLGLEKVGRKDDFFDMGGDSLSVMELISAIGNDGLKVADVVVGRTPAGIAELMGRVQKIDMSNEEECRQKSYNLTAYQLHYYHYWKYTKGIVLGNVPMLLTFDPAVFEAEVIAESVKKVLLNHPAFMTVITEDEDGKARQHFDPEIIKAPEIINITKQEFEVKKAELGRPFELKDNPLFRCEIYKTEETIYLFMDTHHIITDAESVNIFKRDLFDVLAGREIPKDCYASYLEHITKLEASEPELIRPEDDYAKLPRFDMDGTTCETEVISRSGEITFAGLREMAAELGATPLEFYVAASLKAIGEYNGCDKVVTNWIYGGRNAVWKKDMCGLMISAMPVAVEISKFGTLAELAAEVRRVNQINMSYSDLSPGNSGDKPVLQDTITVNYIPLATNNNTGELPDGVGLESLIDSNKANSNAFYIIAFETADDEKPRFNFKFNSSMYKRENMEKFVEMFMKVISDND